MKTIHLTGLAIFCFLGVISPARAATVSINFDVNASGNPISAPAAFDSASPLHNTYATLGVHFAGPTSTEGGAILNSSTFTSPALSGSNFLAFSNSFVAPENVGPETITFDTAMSYVSIFASCLQHPMTVSMQAFDASNTPLDSDTLLLTGAGYHQLSVSSAGNIKSVVLSMTNANNNASVLDNLYASTTPVPEPSTFVLGGLWLLGLGFATLRKKIRRT